MKKLFVVLMVLVMATSAVFAAGKLYVEQEQCILVEKWGSLYAYGYAKVSNVGDKPIKVKSAVLEVFDTNGDCILSEDWGSTYASYLNPGEYTYVSIYDEIDDTSNGVDDYSLNISGMSASSGSCIRLPIKTWLSLGEGSGWWTYDYMYCEFTNNTSEPLYDIDVVFALYDQYGDVVYVYSNDLWSDQALMPGSSMRVRTTIDSYFMDMFEAEGIVPTSVDAIAYVLD